MLQAARSAAGGEMRDTVEEDRKALITAQEQSDDDGEAGPLVAPPRITQEARPSKATNPSDSSQNLQVSAWSSEERTVGGREPEGGNMMVSDSNDNLVEHCHTYNTVNTRNRRAERVLIAVAVLAAIFIVAELVGGALANSLAIMTDAGHIVSDLLGFLISVIAIRLSRRRASQRLSFGFERAEIMGAMISIIIIWMLTAVLVTLAAIRIYYGDYEIEVNPMLITASAGVVFNLIMGAVLHFGHAEHSHHGISHGHSHHHDTVSVESAETVENGSVHNDTLSPPGSVSPTPKKHRNVNVRAALIHVLGDLLQSVGVLIAALIIKFTGWHIADPICTFLFSIIVLATSITVLRDIVFVLMEATPRHIDYSTLRRELGSLKGVLAVHNLHVWSLNMDKIALSVHLAIEDPVEAVETMKSASKLVKTKHGVALATVQVEPFEKIMDSCDACQPVAD